MFSNKSCYILSGSIETPSQWSPSVFHSAIPRLKRQARARKETDTYKARSSNCSGTQNAGGGPWLLQRKQPLTFSLASQVSRHRPKGRRAQRRETLLRAQYAQFPGTDHHLHAGQASAWGKTDAREISTSESEFIQDSQERTIMEKWKKFPKPKPRRGKSNRPGDTEENANNL